MENQSRYRRLDTTDGGELTDWIRRLRTEPQQCPLCLDEFTVTSDVQLWGLRRSDGIVDGDGTSWWVFFSCPNCEFEITHDLLTQ